MICCSDTAPASAQPSQPLVFCSESALALTLTRSFQVTYSGPPDDELEELLLLLLLEELPLLLDDDELELLDEDELLLEDELLELDELEPLDEPLIDPVEAVRVTLSSFAPSSLRSIRSV